MKKRLLTLIFSGFCFLINAQFNPNLFNSMKYRMIGPHRGGRTVGAVGVPQQPNVFYIGVNNGGVWKTNDYGRTWKPIFDDQPTGSVGDIAVAPSNPNVIYVASGEGIQRPDLGVGNGVYKSPDAGKTWVNTGLKDGQQIGSIIIDPTNENRVFVAVLGHPYGPNTERGVYRTIDGGKNWERVLYKDENTGAIQVVFDPKNPNIIYADLWAARQGPWENGAWQGTESGLFKSTDGGNTWKKLSKGLPTIEEGLGRIGFCVAPSDPNRMYATVDAGKLGGIYRSDDAGENWILINPDGRLWGRGSDFAEIKADPKNADIVYTANVVTWKSTDGAKTWTAFRGAPGGDDYHRIWINPDNTDIILIAADQGAIITVNGGETFSSWYNQPTAQFYHVSTDNAFPYNVLGGQQESGSVSITSRSNDGSIGYREWHPAGVEEYGYVASDPLDPNIIYGGKITKTDKRTGQIQNIAPEAVKSGKYRFVRTAPVLFSPIDPKTLFFAGNVLFKTQNAGNSWTIISPDLSRETYSDIPESVGIYRTEEMKKMARRGVIYALAPSPKDINTIWAGTDDGLVHITKDGGKNWRDITPTTPSGEKNNYWLWSKISMVEASHFEVNTAYITINRIRNDDMRPHIMRTRDGGKTWQETVNGLSNDPINSVKEDPNRKGLLFAGSETAVYVSFDDGDNWQSLRLNMPATSIRDLVIKDDDLVIGTHGRSFWILDNITALRQITADLTKSEAIFYKPQNPYKVRWNIYSDTPVPQEEAAGQNPPDGAIFDYFLKEKASEIALEIFDATGKSVRKFSSNDKPYKIPEVNIPLYWIRPQTILSSQAGSQRFVWDMHYKPLDEPASYPISATFMNTAPDATSPWVLAGNYTAKMTVNDKVYTQTFTIKQDPRVKTNPEKMKQIHDMSMICYKAKQKIIAKLEDQKKDTLTKETGAKLNKLKASFTSIFNILIDTDMPVTTQIVKTLVEAQRELSTL
ncbi:MAG: glycoside hydrolase [Arcicella sp.]|nr:glycoside hydrolase [Arcicella sp.]